MVKTAMLKAYPMFKRNQSSVIYNSFDNGIQVHIEDYLKYRKARGLNAESKVQDVKRGIIHFMHIMGDDYAKLGLPHKKENTPLKLLREALSIINNSNATNTVKNDIKSNIKCFLKFSFNDWSQRFLSLEDIRLNQKKNEEKINYKNIFSKKDIEILAKKEPKVYFKAFLLVQYEAGLRTGECRNLKWQDIKLNADGDISEITIYATKTKKARTVYVKEATFYLNALKDEQETAKTKGIFVFNSKFSYNASVSKYTISNWFSDLTKRTLGRQCWNYLLRHSRASELYGMARDNKLSRDTAKEFMGHSSDMSYFYEHINPSKIKEMLKNQVYKLEDMPEEKKFELEKEIEKLKEQMRSYEEKMQIASQVKDKALLEKIDLDKAVEQIIQEKIQEKLKDLKVA